MPSNPLLFSDGFALGFDGVSTPISTQAADIAQIAADYLAHHIFNYYSIVIGPAGWALWASKVLLTIPSANWLN